MESKISVLETDALVQFHRVNINSDMSKVTHDLLNTLLEDFTTEEYKSVFFLLMDYVELHNFFNLTKESKPFLMQELHKIYTTRFNDYSILVELLGTMKKYKKLRLLDSCRCIFKKYKERKFNRIDPIWKMLYSLCEELTDGDLESLKGGVVNNFKDFIVTAEDWFCLSLMNEVFSRTDLSKLEIIFNNYPKCLHIIQNFRVKSKLYDIKSPTAVSHCGIALIINFEIFDEKTRLGKREGSAIDVNSLKDLWQNFGFKTEVHTNLTYSETLKLLELYATFDHSKYDCFICCILSHGGSNSIYSSDGIKIYIPVLIAAISKCTSLDQKPKLFFIQACQGTYIHQGIGEPVYKFNDNCITDETTFNLSIPPITCDILRVTSSIDGYVSFRNPKTGSWFIQILCNLMMQDGDKKSILDVITEVNNEVRKCTAQLDLGPKGPSIPYAQQIVDCFHTFGKTLILKRCID